MTVTHCGLSECSQLSDFNDFDIEKLIFEPHVDDFFCNLQKIEINSSYLGKRLLFWVFWWVSIVVCPNINVWIKFPGKFIIFSSLISGVVWGLRNISVAFWYFSLVIVSISPSITLSILGFMVRSSLSEISSTLLRRFGAKHSLWNFKLPTT